MGAYGSPELYPNNKPGKENRITKALKIIGVTLLSFLAILASIICFGMGIAEKNIIVSIIGIAIFGATLVGIINFSYKISTNKTQSPKNRNFGIVGIVCAVFFLVAAVSIFSNNQTGDTAPASDNKVVTETTKAKSEEEISQEEKKAQKLLTHAQQRFDNADLPGMIRKLNEICNNYGGTQTAHSIERFISDNLGSLPQISSIDFVQEYNDNEVRADEQYKNKLVVLYGTIEDIGKDIVDSTYITLSDGQKYSLKNAQCMFDDEGEIHKVANLQKGDKVRIVGKCRGESLTIPLLKNCHIVHKNDENGAMTIQGDKLIKK